MNAANYRKTACGLCGGRIEYHQAQTGELSPCPHCHQEIVLEGLPPEPPLAVMPPPVRRQPQQRSYSWLWGLLAVLAVSGFLFAAFRGGKLADVISGLGALVVLLLALGLYFLPTILADQRKHRQQAPIFVINLFLGWTLLGWVAALAWALYEESGARPPTEGKR